MKNTVQKMLVALGLCMAPAVATLASSHREAPLIAYDPQADNTDLYAFRSPTDSSKIIIVANYIPFEAPQGGPNWYTFGNNIRYEIHVKNNASTLGDNITYRFTFKTVNEDSTTFFNIRLGKQNRKTTYTLERIINNGSSFTIVSNGIVPPPNIGPRSIEGGAGLNVANYDTLMQRSIMKATSGERIYAGPIDDPFFVDLGGAFDLGGFRQPGRDGLAKFNCHSLVLEVPVSNLQKNNQPVTAALNILDPNYVIGIWASASRQTTQTLNGDGTVSGSGQWVQISRLGMPLTNEVIIPIGKKDLWNSLTPNASTEQQFYPYFRNPELSLYVDTSINGYGKAVPGLSNYLHIQSASRPSAALGPFDFRNGKAGLYPLKGNPALVGTAFDPATYGNLLLPNNTSPRSVDILPIFLTGVPNLAPYQLFSTKANGNPLSAGKPFINNFLPYVGDMLRLNMATPATPRFLPGGVANPDFSSLGLVAAAIRGLTDATYMTTNNIQPIPNMDGFPNGRRLEDDVTTIELMAIGGGVLAAIGLPYDDYTPGITPSPLTPTLLSVLGFNAGVTHNDTTFKSDFPFVQQPWRSYNGAQYSGPVGVNNLSLSAPDAIMVAYPNPFVSELTFKYKLATSGKVQIDVIDINGRVVNTMSEGAQTAGEHFARWNAGSLSAGNYFARLSVGGTVYQTLKLVKAN
jgi:hypothetical protein